ncbi:MAG: protein kinase [Anaerolineae bacterium]|nr:protein kinase [Anaerolineae bacterium]
MAEDSLIGRQFANFRIERLIGHGGMAQVYYGQDVSLRRPVAIKIIDARFRGHATYAERFVREAQTVATWRHEHILQVFYADEESGVYYFVMEYIDGLDLAQLLAHYAVDGELMPFDDVIRIGRAVTSALDYAHERGVIHRDVKPSNVMISTDDRVVLMDFGLAMDVQQGSLGEIFGTPHYIAPEQARRSADAVPQSDIYALGVVLYEMLTGAVPFDDPSPASLALQHLTLAPPSPREINPDLNVQTEQVLLKALSKSAEERYQTGAELFGALEASLRADPTAIDDVVALPPPPAGVGPLTLSRQTVADRVAEYVSATHTPTAFPEPLIATTKSPSRTDRIRIRQPDTQQTSRRWTAGLLVAIVGFVLIVVVGAVLVLTRDGDGATGDTTDADPADSVAVLPTASAMPESVESTATLAVETAVVPPPVEIDNTLAAPAPDTIPTNPTTTLPMPTQTPLPSVTATAMPLPTALPTETPPPTLVPTATILPTATPVPTVTQMPTATNTALPTPTNLPPPTQPLEPTILYPDGGRFKLFYDANTLVLRNISGDKVALQPFAFERLGANDVPLNRFEGVRWAQFYPYVHHQSCVRLLVADGASFLNPSQCQTYNAEVWPERGMSLDFFTPQAESTHFRVLWNAQEIGRCEIAVGECVVYIP